VPGEDAADNLPFGITLFSTNENEHLIAGLADLFLHGKAAREHKTTSLIGVCGLHMKGFPLESQMEEHGAVFVREAKTASVYKMVKLPSTPPKPGLIRVSEAGASIELELWEMPLAELGAFAAKIPAPLGIGKVQLEDGTEVPGFICEGLAAENAEDISHTGGWRFLPE
jgi:allophanate hydrolase